MADGILAVPFDIDLPDPSPPGRAAPVQPGPAPPVLDDLGLVSALEALVDDVRQRSALTVSLAVKGTSRRLPADTELALFRIGQAAVHNVERHAKAAHATVEIAFGPERVWLVIADA